MNSLICIAGTSGVGKTTVANLLSCVLENNSSIIISGDDCHKWREIMRCGKNLRISIQKQTILN